MCACHFAHLIGLIYKLLQIQTHCCVTMTHTAGPVIICCNDSLNICHLETYFKICGSWLCVRACDALCNIDRPSLFYRIVEFFLT